jgi:ribose transport system permease protein
MPLRFAARHVPIVLFLFVYAAFAAASPTFRTPANAVNILVQSSSTVIVATGMTFVMLTAGIDLSVGAVMFLSAALAGRLVLGGWAPGVGPIPVWAATLLMLPMGVAFGSLNALLVARLRLMPFLVTLATLFIGRGLALRVTQTRALNLPDAFLAIGSARVAGVPLPVLLSVATALVAQLVLAHTPFGRQVYALGDNPDAARKAGLRPERLLAAVYVISGLCAALGGVVSVAQLGAVSPTFGNQREFAAIAAAVVGGTSLFGGRGTVFPGTFLGAVLIQTIEAGLNVTSADPYSYPVVVGCIIFAAVAIEHGTSRHVRAAGGPDRSG